MNYTQIIKEIKAAAMSQPNVNSFYEGDVYDILHRNDILYSTVVMSIENTWRQNGSVTYNVVIYYADRLKKDESNKVSIFDDATMIINNIIDVLPDDISYESPTQTVFFEQEFEDYLAGAYLRIGLQMDADIVCGWEAESEEMTINITQNGIFNVKEFDYAVVNVEGGGGEEEIERLRHEIGILNNEIGELNGEINELNNHIGILNGEIGELTAETQEMAAEIEQKQQTINNLNQEIVSLGAEIEDKNNRINELNEIINNLNDSINSSRYHEYRQNGNYTTDKLGYNEIRVNVPSVTVQELTQAEYDEIEDPDENVIYLIKF